MHARLLLGAAAAIVLTTPSPATAFVQYRTETTQLAFHWAIACVPIRVYADDLPDMTPEEIMRAAQGAAAAWSAAANPCSRVNIVVERASGPGPEVAYDGASTITFRRTSWCAADDAPGTCSYDASATGISTIFVARATGEIRDADIEVNAKTFSWGDVGLQPGARQDLQSVLTHEMGHILGFDHTCVVPGLGAPPFDDLGDPAPACDEATAAVRETTMFPVSSPNDISKRTLEPDDRRAVCATYPNPTPRANAGAEPPSFAACTSAVDGGADGGGDASEAPDATGSDATGPDDAPVERDAPGGGPSRPFSEGRGCALSEGNGSPWPPLGLALLFLLARPHPRRTMAPTNAHRRLRL